MACKIGFPTSQCRQNFDKDTEESINNQTNLFLTASHAYLSLSVYCDRDEMALKGFHDYFKKRSDDLRESAEKVHLNSKTCFSHIPHFKTPPILFK